MCTKTILTTLLVAGTSMAFAQQIINVDKSDGVPVNAFYTVNGIPFNNVRYVRLAAGSPYFSDDWLKGVAVSDKDVRYRNKHLKLDLLTGELHFLTQKGEDLISTIPMKELVLADTAMNKTYHFVQASYVPALAGTKRGWYQVLVNGKVSLFRNILKIMQEIKPYNAGVDEQKIFTTEEFLVVYNGTVLKAKKPKDLPALLSDGKPELEAYLKREESKQGAVAEQMAALVNYYNSLQ